MRGNFRWERDTENYRRYCSETKDPATGKFRVVYFPKSGLGDLPKIIPNLIVSDSEHGIQCCYRDNDWDGNCSIHSAPGVLREIRDSTPLAVGMEIYREAAERTRQYTDAYDPRRDFVIRGTQTGRFSSTRWADGATEHEQVRRLTKRVFDLEQKQNILFEAIAKILRMMGWKKGKKPPKVVPPGSYDAVLRDTELSPDGRLLTVDLEIVRTA